VVILPLVRADVYATNKGTTFVLILPRGNPSALPGNIIKSLGRLHFVRTVKLDRLGLPSANSAKIHADFVRQGYSIRELNLDLEADK